MLGLLQSRSLASAELVPVGALAREGPDLCEMVLRAMESDTDLERLGAMGEDPIGARAARLAGAEGPAAAVEAIESLRAGLLATLIAARPGDPHLLLNASDRLSHVCAQLAGAAVASSSAGEAQASDIDPLAQLASARALRTGQASSEPPEPPLDLRRSESSVPARPLWMAALERQLAEGGRSGRRFVLALVDVDGADRLRLAGPAAASESQLAAVGRAIREQVRRADLLAHEEDGRSWVVAGDAGRGASIALANRLAGAVERLGVAAGAASRGTPLTVSVGVAVYPDDGRDAVTLAERAEEQMFAARAAGVPVADDGPEAPVTRGV